MTRRGISLLETVVACFLVGVALTLALQFFHAVAENRRAINERMAAQAEAANIIDRLSNFSWDALPVGTFGGPSATNESKKALPSAAISDEAKKILPAASVEVQIQAAAGQPTAKRICVRVLWPAEPGLAPHDVHLVTWKYKGS
jgi:hypothetical protein